MKTQHDVSTNSTKTSVPEPTKAPTSTMGGINPPVVLTHIKKHWADMPAQKK